MSKRRILHEEPRNQMKEIRKQGSYYYTLEEERRLNIIKKSLRKKGKSSTIIALINMFYEFFKPKT